MIRNCFRAVARFLLALTCLSGVACMAAPGQLDPGFGNGGVAFAPATRPSEFRAMALQPDGKIVLAGPCVASRFCVTRIGADGALDLAFGGSGTGYIVVTTPAPPGSLGGPTSVAVQADGGILVAGECWMETGGADFCVVRLTAAGTLDTAFGGGTGTVSTAIGSLNDTPASVLAQPDGKFVVVGTCGGGVVVATMLCLAKYQANGELDVTFAGAGRYLTGLGNGVYRALSRADGGMLVAMTCPLSDTQAGQYPSVFCLVALGADGQLDSGGFAGGTGIARTQIRGNDWPAAGIAQGADGALVMAGNCQEPGNPSSFVYCAVRYTAQGAIDSSFNGGTPLALGLPVPTSGSLWDVAVQVDGKIVVATICFDGSTSHFCLARLNRDGSIDTSFGSNGVSHAAVGLAESQSMAVAIVPSSGQIVAAGNCVQPDGRGACVARYEGGPYPAKTCALNVDDNLLLTPATDGAIVLRYLLDLKTPALQANALGPDALRTSAALEAYLATLNLDADGDGQTLATTDGLLILRAMRGLTGDALTAGATNASHPNVRNAQQILSWIETTHGVACLP